MIKYLWMVSAMVCVVGCSQTDSDNIKTSGMRADIHVSAWEEGATEVIVNLSVGSGGIGGTEVELSSGDSLVARAFGETKTLRKKSDLLGIHYETAFASSAGSEAVVVAFNRADGDGAPNSTVVLPQSFMVAGPSSGQELDADEVLMFSWSPTSTTGTFSIKTFIDCSYDDNQDETVAVLDIETITIEDDGAYDIYVSDLLASLQNQLPNSGLCDLKVTFTRRNTGELDPGFEEGGSISAIQTREREYRITL